MRATTARGLRRVAILVRSAGTASASLLDRMLYADLKTYLVELLMKQDQMSMAASIESRVPFLDHELVEFAARLPDSWKLRGFTTKRILRAAAADLLPREILERPKMGFPVPFADWMRGPLDPGRARRAARPPCRPARPVRPGLRRADARPPCER